MKKKFSVLFFLISYISYSQIDGYSWNTEGITVAGGNGAGSALNQLNFPYSIYIDSNNTLFIADTQNHRIQKWLANASEGITVAGGNGPGDNPDQLNTPTCIWVDENQTIYIMDSFNNRIQKWILGATEGITVAGGNGEGPGSDQFNKAGGFYLRNNAFYVVDAGNNRIVKWVIGEDTGTIVAAGTQGNGSDQLSNPTVNGTIYVDENESLYVTDYINNRVQKFVPGQINATTVAGGNGSGTADNQLKAPNGIFMLPNGRMIISEYTGRRINMWIEGESQGVVVAGGNGNGSAANQFKSPRGNFIASNGDLYVTDMANHRVQRFEKVGNENHCTGNLGGGLEPAFITVKINDTSFDHNTYIEPTDYYHEYPATSNTTATLVARQSYGIYTFTSSEAIIGIWIDYNQNDEFEANEFTELVNNMNAQNTTSFTIPTDIVGDFKMRIRSRAYGSSILPTDACTNFGSGETRDYTLTVVENPLSVKDFDLLEVKAYPNPVKDILNISSEQEISGIEIFNLLGQRIAEKKANSNTASIDLSVFPQGNYFLKIKSVNSQKTLKVVKQ